VQDAHIRPPWITTSRASMRRGGHQGTARTCRPRPTTLRIICGQGPVIKRVCRARATGEARPVRAARPNACCPSRCTRPRCSHACLLTHRPGLDPALHAPSCPRSPSHVTRPRRPHASTRTCRTHRQRTPLTRPRTPPPARAPQDPMALSAADTAWSGETRKAGRRAKGSERARKRARKTSSAPEQTRDGARRRRTIAAHAALRAPAKVSEQASGSCPRASSPCGEGEEEVR